MFTRTRYQQGSLQLKKRSTGEEVWEFRWYEPDEHGRRKRRAATVGSLEQYPTESAAKKSAKVQAQLLSINSEHTQAGIHTPSFGALLARYEHEEMPERYSTRAAYQSHIDKHLRPRWADTPLHMVKPMAVEDWLRALNLAPKTKSHIRSLMRTVFKCAQRWELIDRNPIELVRVKGGTKRQEKPRVLTIAQFDSLLLHIKEPYRTMVQVAGCLGLRVSEIMALQWGDFDFERQTVLVRRGIVQGHVGDVKTEYSRDEMPLDPLLAETLLQHKGRCYPTSDGWLFANPNTGWPYHQEEIQKRHICRAAVAAGISGAVGWHTFRHSYRSWLDEGGVGIGVQKELMRHASIQTTMNVYGEAMSETKRAANSKVVEMVLKKIPAGSTSGSSEQEPLLATGS